MLKVDYKNIFLKLSKMVFIMTTMSIIVIKRLTTRLKYLFIACQAYLSSLTPRTKTCSVDAETCHLQTFAVLRSIQNHFINCYYNESCFLELPLNIMKFATSRYCSVKYIN